MNEREGGLSRSRERKREREREREAEGEREREKEKGKRGERWGVTWTASTRDEVHPFGNLIKVLQQRLRTESCTVNFIFVLIACQKVDLDCFDEGRGDSRSPSSHMSCNEIYCTESHSSISVEGI